jgi:F0F1-type ATP synthase assembly protein I
VDLKAQTNRDLFNGFGNALSVAFELAMTPILFAGGGHLVDRWAGTSPLFLILFVILAVVGLGAKEYYTYAARMAEHEKDAPWARK